MSFLYQCLSLMRSINDWLFLGVESSHKAKESQWLESQGFFGDRHWGRGDPALETCSNHSADSHLFIRLLPMLTLELPAANWVVKVVDSSLKEICIPLPLKEHIL